MNRSFVSVSLKIFGANSLDGEVKLIPAGCDMHKMATDHITACEFQFVKHSCCSNCHQLSTEVLFSV